METAEDQVRQHVPDRRPRHDRTGMRASMIVFSGATTLMAASEPALFGSFGATTHLTPNDV